MNVLRAFRRRAAIALEDRELNDNIRRSTGMTLAKRRRLAAADPDYDELREKVAAIRRESLERRTELLAEATRQLTAAGVQVHTAATAEEARRLVAEIATRHEARLVVKGKSMISEEIELTPLLQQRGLEVLETDLGEFIVQLLGQPPSHITAPALHLNRRQVGRVFSDKLGADYTEIPEELTEIARRYLRAKFLEADIGISGGNFIVAETGTLALVENEGNIGLGTTLPRVHIAITGIEKIVPRLDDLAPLLRILPLNATGQRAAGYASLLNGPAPPPSADDPPTHGPQEMHVIFLDNGRTHLARSRQADILRCLRCGSCLNICPIFRHLGGHAYGSVYPAAMGVLLSPWLLPIPHKGARVWRGAAVSGPGHHPGNSLADVCALCAACDEICPAMIPLSDLILSAREDKGRTAPLMQRAAFRLFGGFTKHPRLFAFAGRCLRGGLRHLPARLLAALSPAWSRGRALPPIPDKSCSETLKREHPTRLR
ncbi:MAG: lactate utilization protein [bacterium]|nr:lactate utilization protein [bacterium]